MAKIMILGSLIGIGLYLCGMLFVARGALDKRPDCSGVHINYNLTVADYFDCAEATQ